MTEQKQQESSWFLYRLENINEIDISELAKSAVSSRLHYERLSRKGLTEQARIVRSGYEGDARSLGLSPNEIDSRIGKDRDYEKIRGVISSYVRELKSKKTK